MKHTLLSIVLYCVLQLLPEHSTAGLIVVTDGVLNIPDISSLDTLLNQLRTKTVCLSFLQV